MNYISSVCPNKTIFKILAFIIQLFPRLSLMPRGFFFFFFLSEWKNKTKQNNKYILLNIITQVLHGTFLIIIQINEIKQYMFERTVFMIRKT